MFITYHAAPGDDVQVEYLGLSLADGEPVEIPADADPAKVEKAKQNPCFEVGDTRPSGAVNLTRRGPGRPPKVEE